MPVDFWTKAPWNYKQKEQISLLKRLRAQLEPGEEEPPPEEQEALALANIPGRAKLFPGQPPVETSLLKAVRLAQHPTREPFKVGPFAPKKPKAIMPTPYVIKPFEIPEPEEVHRQKEINQLQLSAFGLTPAQAKSLAKEWWEENPEELSLSRKNAELAKKSGYPIDIENFLNHEGLEAILFHKFNIPFPQVHAITQRIFYSGSDVDLQEEIYGQPPIEPSLVKAVRLAQQPTGLFAPVRPMPTTPVQEGFRAGPSPLLETARAIGQAALSSREAIGQRAVEARRGAGVLGREWVAPAFEPFAVAGKEATTNLFNLVRSLQSLAPGGARPQFYQAEGGPPMSAAEVEERLKATGVTPWLTVPVSEALTWLSLPGGVYLPYDAAQLAKLTARLATKGYRLAAKGAGKYGAELLASETGFAKLPGKAGVKAVGVAKEPLVAEKPFYAHILEAGKSQRAYVKIKDAKAIVLPGFEDIDAFISRPFGQTKGWLITDAKTGLILGDGSTKQGAIEVAKTRLAKAGKETYEATIAQVIEKQGLSPRYSQPTKPVVPPPAAPVAEAVAPKVAKAPAEAIRPGFTEGSNVRMTRQLGSLQRGDIVTIKAINEEGDVWLIKRVSSTEYTDYGWTRRESVEPLKISKAEEINPYAKMAVSDLQAAKQRFINQGRVAEASQISDELAQRGIAPAEAIPKAEASLEQYLRKYPWMADEVARARTETEAAYVADKMKEARASVEELGARLAPGQREIFIKEYRKYNALTEAPTEAIKPPVRPEIPITTKRPSVEAPGAIPKAEVGEAGGVPPAGPTVPPVQPPGAPTRTMQEADDFIAGFSKYLQSPESQRDWVKTLDLRKAALSRRLGNYQQRVGQLMAEGKATDEALNQALQDTMTGRLPGIQTGIAEELTNQAREAMFAKVYYSLANEPTELISTVEALTNALLGKAIPRIPGIKGGSAYTRLMRIFGDNTEVMKVLEQKTGLRAAIEDKVLQASKKYPPSEWYMRPPEWKLFSPDIPFGKPRLGEPGWTPVGPQGIKTAAQREQALLDLRLELLGEPKAGGALPPLEPPIADALQGSLMPPEHQHLVVRVLKGMGFTVQDIGNLLRANRSSFDQSFGRQVAPLIARHPILYEEALVKAWVATFKEGAAEASQAAIHNNWRYRFYEELKLDFERVLKPPPGQVLRGEEAFGYAAGGERPIQRLTMAIPWVKMSNRGFVTGVNEMSFNLFYKHIDDILAMNEKFAAGMAEVPKNWNIKREIEMFGRMLEDMTGRARLGPMRSMAPTLNAFFWAARLNLGRLFTPRHLISKNPRVARAAWENLGAFAASVIGVELLGEQLGLWEVGKYGHTKGKIRLGQTWFDPWVGFQQFGRFFEEFASGTATSASTGAEYKVDRVDLTWRFLKSKVAPMVGVVRLGLTGKKYIGQTFDPERPGDWIDELAPLAIADIAEAFEKSGFMVGMLSIPAAILGMGMVSTTHPLDALVKKSPDLRKYGTFEALREAAPKLAAQLELTPEATKIYKETTPAESLIQIERETKQTRYNQQVERSKWEDQGWRPGRTGEAAQVTYSTKQWREDLADMYQEASIVADTRERLLGKIELKPKNEKEKALQDYYKISDQFNPDKGGIRDIPGLAQAQESFLAGLTPELEKYILDNLGVRDDAKAEQFRKDKRVIKKDFWEPLRGFEAQWQQKEIAMNQALIAKAQGDLQTFNRITAQYNLKGYAQAKKNFRLRLKMQSPELDRLLVQWGYYEVYAHPANKALQRQGAFVGQRELAPVGAR